MAPEEFDDRDSKLEKALARHLRPGSGSAAQQAQPAPATPQVCPDPEILAAYHERSLLPEERSACKLHIEGCANCQSIFADLESTDDIPLTVTDERVAAAAPQVHPPDSVPAKRRRRMTILHGTRWKWLAPAGALAASLLVWIAWHEEAKPITTKSGSVEMARVQEPPVPLQEADRVSPPSSPHERQSKQDSSNLAAATRPARRDELSPATSDKNLAHSRSRSEQPEILLDKKSAKSPTLPASDARVSTETVGLQSAAPATGGSGGAGLKKERELQDQLSNAQSRNLNQIAANAPRVAGPAPLNQVAPAAAKKAKSVPAAPPPAPASAGTLDPAAASALEVVSVSDPRLILAADGSTSWRTGRAGLIELSSEDGKTWTRQFSGVLTDLLTGTAPSASTCWIVGRTGTVLVTTDGGAHWKLIKAPFTDDLGGVRATDALHATIWNSRNTRYYQTSDGGQSWQSTAAP